MVLALSAALHAAGVAVAHPLTGETVAVTNLVSAEGLRRLALNVVPNFIGFAPLGPVLVSLMGLSVAERSGLLGAVVRAIVGATPPRVLTLMIVFCGAISHTGGDVGYVLLIPLGAALFHSMGRHPLGGLAAAFYGVSGGFAANILLSPTGNDAQTQSLQQAFAVANGVKEADFKREYNGFSVNTRLQRAEELMRRYRVESVPLVIVNGKYQTDVGMAGSPEKLISLIEDLVATEKSR